MLTQAKYWEDRLLHNKPEVRFDANIDLKQLCDSVTDPKDPRIRGLGHLFKKTVTDSDPYVQDKALDALTAYLKAADAHVAGRYGDEVCDALMAVCLTGGPKTKCKAETIFMLWVELEAVHAFLDTMEKAVKSQDAKSAVIAINFTIQALSEFGIRIVRSSRIIKMLMDILDHQDQNVLTSSKGLTLELCRWIGIYHIKSDLYPKMSDKMKEELDVEFLTLKAKVHPPRRIRSELKVGGFLAFLLYGTVPGPSEESAAENPLGEDKKELVDLVDISIALKKSGFWNNVKSRKWTQRKEAVAKLNELASKKMIVLVDDTELGHTLKKLITDRSTFVRVEAVRAIGNLALGLMFNFSRCSHILLPVLLAKLREKRPIMTEALTNTLQAIHKAGCVNLVNILTDVKSAVKSEDPRVCSRTLNWLVYCIDSSNMTVILEVHKDYVQISLECLNDGTAEVRDAAFSVLVAIDKLVGIGLSDMPLEKVDDVGRKKLSEMIAGFSGGAASTVTRKQCKSFQKACMAHHMKAGGPCQHKLVGHKHVEPSEMTQLKNAAWKEPLKEINQVQKMSFSHPKEQNKKDIDGVNGYYYESQKSHPGWWRADDFSLKRLIPMEPPPSLLSSSPLPSLLSPSCMKVRPLPYSPYPSLACMPKLKV